MTSSTSNSNNNTLGGPSLMETLFQRTVDDLIKGIRLHNPGSAQSSFISKSLDEIRREIKSTDLATKSIAVNKLTYLHSLHNIDISFAAFHAVELTSSPIFNFKKIGYLAASLSFSPSTDVILLLTNQLRKDLTSANVHDVSLALECISAICTVDIARDLTPDVFNLMTSSKNIVKKKAIACLLKVFSQFPDAVRVCFKRLVENLEKNDDQMLAATVGVFCELCSKEPRAYLPLAPELYRILVECRNNWVLIKVLKIFEKLAKLEPRLAKKVVEPICDVMKRSEAKSLVFECVRTIVSSFYEYEFAVKLAVGKIREFLLESDLNLRYLGLQGLLIVGQHHLWAVLENKEIVIKSLSDVDRNIKVEALRLVMSMVSEDNVVEICRVLIGYALKSDPEFCNEILRSMLLTCSSNVYEIVNDFDWYVSLLGEMSRIPHCQNGEEIEYQLIDIGMRVKDVRPELVRVGRDLLIDPALLGNPFIHRILSAAAWVSGEYVRFSRNPSEIMEALLQPRTNLLPPSIRAVYIHSAFKVLSFCLGTFLLPNKDANSSFSNLVDMDPGFTYSESEQEFTETEHGANSSSLHKKDMFTRESIVNLLTLVITSLSPLADSHDVEIQERVRNLLGLALLAQQEISCHHEQKEKRVDWVDLKTYILIRLVNDALSEEFGPISSSAQDRVPVPDGLVLEENLSKLDSICADVQLPISEKFSLVRPTYLPTDGDSLSSRQNEDESETSAAESTSLLAEHRKRHGLFYLPSDNNKNASTSFPPANDPDHIDKDVEDLVKLTEESLVLKRKPNQARPRPVVVKLDEGDRHPTIAVKKIESNDDLISGAVRDVLLGNEPLSQSNQLGKPSGRKKGKAHAKVDQGSELKDNTENSETGNSGKRRSKHRSHGKEKKHSDSGNNVEGREENGKEKSGGRHGRHKAKQSGGGIDVVDQKQVIPDFLL
ncbi:Adaptor protein complex AP-3, delta subunit [Artemisia annua]|uniref:AP-3 complex subunit delta n=1 Tax=Artemisia annua TaxID=35608 RepID=A0A2U1MT79_ARTAN|nr:Adaptor protein complex AP-3, delta subunit [Artemisia annua]